MNRAHNEMHGSRVIMILVNEIGDALKRSAVRVSADPDMSRVSTPTRVLLEAAFSIILKREARGYV
jgi:hypothetical protein